ncbi:MULTISPECIES: hypothetical protein [unclassified Mesorhizobium]|uniref:hypothetical protein n=1 Tax=unclassified Mesorhizobium TaxID=325217 RepID=UPI000FDC2264|nr:MULTISPECIES: hypothetical protein [unclassified Mesorhizobium]TGT76164.1 hypothetical protein EN809_000630 [Mesorhizobium sp. M2E.F.Ca.ET.166.01.1.1]TGW02279.1 hypothetical protein EN797_000630 [Mesorhizobium sp. M2E.F.Ca.ET.154.01.1.1]
MVAPLTDAEIKRRIDAVNAHPTLRAAARALGLKPSTLGHFVESLKAQRQAPPEMPEIAPPSPAEIRDVNFWRNKAKKAEEQAATSEHVLREMAGVFQRPLSLPEWVLPGSGETGRAVGLVHLSDLHCGEVVRPEETGGINAYNPEIFRRRFRRMIDASIRILPRWSSDCDLKGVVVALNGDLVSGDIHAELRETNALTSHEQVALVTDEAAAGLRKLADTFGAVLVTVTPGNHGRTTEKTHAKRMAALSYDVMIGNILAREFASDPRITVNCASGADIVFPLFGWSVLQTHGDSMGTGGGMGFAGPELPIVRGGKKIKLSGFATGEHYDIILTAHYHTSSNPGTVLANGSMVGYSEYALRIRGLPEPPQQWLALIHEKWGLRERVPVVLEDPARPKRARIRVPAGMSVS